MGNYGIKAAELAAVTDHRFKKALIDFYELRSQVDAANANAKKLRKGTQAGASRAQVIPKGGATVETEALIKQAKASGLVHDQVAAVAALLGDIK